MRQLKLQHVNNCKNCPILGAEDIPGEEEYHFLALRIEIARAAALVAKRKPQLLSHDYIRKIAGMVRINDAHLDHIPNPHEPGIAVVLPNKLGTLLVDGNHRAQRALRDGYPFYVRVVKSSELAKLGVPKDLITRLETAP